jgi:hypothetical protein
MKFIKKNTNFTGILKTNKYGKVNKELYSELNC